VYRPLRAAERGDTAPDRRGGASSSRDKYVGLFFLERRQASSPSAATRHSWPSRSTVARSTNRQLASSSATKHSKFVHCPPALVSARPYPIELNRDVIENRCRAAERFRPSERLEVAGELGETRPREVGARTLDAVSGTRSTVCGSPSASASPSNSSWRCASTRIRRRFDASRTPSPSSRSRNIESRAASSCAASSPDVIGSAAVAGAVLSSPVIQRVSVSANASGRMGLVK